MLKTIKKMIKKIIPASWHHVDYRIREVDRHIGDVEKRTNSRFSSVDKQLSGVDKRMCELNNRISMLTKNVEGVNASVDKLEKINGKIEQLQTGLNGQKEKTDKIASSTNEILWAQIFNNTIVQSNWLKSKEFSPGRWAAGYPFLYILYRVLDEAKPKSILELGLGQTTKMISQYATEYNVHHDVVEHDKKWISFFNNDFPLPGQTKIARLDLTERQFLDDDKVIAYSHFNETFEGKRYDLLSIDGPFGGMAKTFARVDVLELLPDCLNESFVIMIDDYNRKGEQHTVEVLKKILTERGIPFFEGVYWGEKAVCIITSASLRFLCSL